MLFGFYYTLGISVYGYVVLYMHHALPNYSAFCSLTKTLSRTFVQEIHSSSITTTCMALVHAHTMYIWRYIAANEENALLIFRLSLNFNAVSRGDHEQCHKS